MTVNVLNMGPGTLTLGDEEDPTSLSSQVTSVKLVPNVDNGDPINVLSGESVPGDRDETFTLEGTLVQDFGVVESTTEWLFTNRGTLVAFTFVPNTSRGRAITGNLTVEAIDIGGDAKTKPTSDFTFTLSGAPVLGPVGP